MDDTSRQNSEWRIEQNTSSDETDCFLSCALDAGQDPLFLDLIGICHTETTSPNPLKLKDLSRYRTHMARGLTFFSPDILSTMLKEGKLLVDENGALTLPPEVKYVLWEANSFNPASLEKESLAYELVTTHPHPHNSQNILWIWISPVNSIC